MAVRTPSFAVPFHVTNGQVAVVEQDSQTEIRNCVQALLSTRLGSRIEEPEYGIPDQLFELLGSPEPNVDAVMAVLAEWEPRAVALSRTEVEDLTKRVVIELSGD